MSTKVVYRYYTSLPGAVREEIKANPILAPLMNEQNINNFWSEFGDIPRHHPELVRIIEAAIIQWPENSVAFIEVIEGSSYLITEADGREWVWSEKSFIDATLPLDPEAKEKVEALNKSMEEKTAALISLAPDNFSTPDWDFCYDWRKCVPDNIRVSWNTFTEIQKANLAIHFDSLFDENLEHSLSN